MVKQRKVPLRKCVVTNEMHAKQDLIRLVRTKDGEVFVDATGKKNGRGAYLTINRDVFNKAKAEHTLEKIFQVDIADTVYDELFALADKYGK